MSSSANFNGNQDVSADPVLQRLTGRKKYPLSLNQQHMWFQCQLDAESSLYNLGARMSVSGPLDPATFVRAIQNTVDRHEILRTVFTVSEDLPVQQVIDEVRVECPVRNSLEGASEGERDDKIWNRMAELGDPVYDLSSGPLFRAELLRAGDTQYYFIVAFHHLLLDAFYSGQMMKEIVSAYDLLRRGQPLPNAPDLQYGDFCVWQQARFNQGRMNETASFWREQLREPLPELQLPCDRSAPLPRPVRAQVSLVLDAAITAKLREIGKQARTTLFRVALATVALFFSRLIGSDELIFDIDFSTRPREMGHSIGFFANLLPVRLQVMEDESFVDLVRAVDSQLRKVAVNREFPVRQLTRKLKGRHDAMQPLSPVVVTQLGALDWAVGELHLSGTIYATASVHDLWLCVLERNDDLEIILGYPEQIIERSRIREWAIWIEQLVKQVTQDPNAPILQAVPISEDQQDGLWSTTAANAGTAGNLEEVIIRRDG